MNVRWIAAAAVAAVLAQQTGGPFREIAARAGLAARIGSGGLQKNYVLEVNGSGACWLDYDEDGLMDLYLVNGATLAELQGKAPRRQTNRLYRNAGAGKFVDVTAKAGVPGRGWGFGCVAADYDGDEHTDLLVTNFGHNVLYRNRGNGTFEDATAKAGVAGGERVWHAGAAFADYDRDGDLDLFMPGYLAFDIAKPELRTCEHRGIKVHACGPLGYTGDPDTLYRNNGDGTFTDVTEQAGVADKKLYFGFQAVWEDFDNDGWPDLFVGNDSNPNYLYRNKGDGAFEERGAVSGAAFSGEGKEMSSMGVAAGDYDRDGLTDLFITTFADDNYVLLRNEGGGFFADESYPSGVGEPTVPYLGWAAMFLDYDNDGWLDLFCANGHVFPEVDRGGRESYKQPLQLFRNQGGKFRAVPLGLAPAAARGGSAADFDNDGDMDIVVSTMDGPPLLLENTAAPRGNWLRVRLQGGGRNTMGVGARVKVTAEGVSQHGSVRAGGSYLSSNDPRLHFGLGSAKTADIEVVWPSGEKQAFSGAAANREIVIREAPAR